MGRGDDPPRLSGLMFHRNTSGGQERSFGEVSGGTEYPMKRPVGARPLSEGVSSGSGSGAGVIGGSFRSSPGPRLVVRDTLAAVASRTRLGQDSNSHRSATSGFSAARPKSAPTEHVNAMRGVRAEPTLPY